MNSKHNPIYVSAIVPKGVILLAVMVSALFYFLTREGIAETRTLTIIHTNNVTGHLFPCPT
jgi:hypothetical protein